MLDDSFYIDQNSEEETGRLHQVLISMRLIRGQPQAETLLKIKTRICS